jgi:hypothetical protein
MTQRGRAEVFVHAAPDGPDAYRTSMHYLTQVGGQRRSYGLLTKSSFTSEGVCEEHGLLVPADAPIDATRGCAAIVKEEPNALTFQSATNGTWTLHRAHVSELETLLAEAIRRICQGSGASLRDPRSRLPRSRLLLSRPPRSRPPRSRPPRGGRP